MDYIAEHLTANGRAAIIVPEGIIFQSQTAYKDLRKMLVENSLVAVISLPAGCFNPYSGVKTSILILDKSLAKTADTIAFFKVENDGFGLGAQRRAIEKNDLPQVQAELAAYLQALRSDSRDPRKDPTDQSDSGKDLSDPANLSDPTDLRKDQTDLFNPLSTAQIVPKAKLAANGDYNLSGERYREGATSNHSFPLVFLGEESLFRVESGGTPKSDVEEYWSGGIPWATLVDLPATEFISEIKATKRTIYDKGLRESSAKMIPANSVVVSTRATIGRIAINRVPIATNQGFKNVVLEDSTRAVPEFVALALTKLVPTMQAWATGGTFAEISKSKFCELQIPLPPLEVQKEIVAEIEGYQKVINGARAVLDHYRPHIPIHPDWPMVPITEVSIRITKGSSPNWQGIEYTTADNGIMFVTSENVGLGQLLLEQPKYVERRFNEIEPKSILQRGDVLTNIVGASIGRTAIYDLDTVANVNQAVCVIRPNTELVNSIYLMTLLNSPEFIQRLLGNSVENARANVSMGVLGSLTIPLPPLATQQAIVAEIEAEQALVAANRELITRFEQKIQATLARIWGEAPASELATA